MTLKSARRINFRDYRRSIWTSLAAFVTLLMPAASGYAQTVPTATASAEHSENAAAEDGDQSIRPFHVNVSQDVLTDLKCRLSATRWPEQEIVADRSQGVQLATMEALVSYWQTGYDCITLYWLTKTAVSSARLYWESKLPFFAPKDIRVPTAVSVFPDEIYAAPKSWTEKAYPNLLYYNRLPKGGRFAAWEQPEYFVTELRVAFRPLRATN